MAMDPSLASGHVTYLISARFTQVLHGTFPSPCSMLMPTTESLVFLSTLEGVSLREEFRGWDARYRLAALGHARESMSASGVEGFC